MISITSLLSIAAVVVPSFSAPTIGDAATLVKRNNSGPTTCHVTALGGGQDDGPNILAAFKNCSDNAVIVLNGNYTVGTVLTAELNSVEIQLTGKIQYTDNISYWSPNSLYLTYQNATTAFFLSGKDILLHGGGTIDGNGKVWWDALANGAGVTGVAGGSSTTFARPVPLTIGNATNVVVDHIQILNSPFWNNFCYQSNNVTYSNIFMYSVAANASARAKNTDGIDIYRSDNIHIHDWVVNNGDDCVSFKPNTSNVVVERLRCDGGHGISVGSLGQYKDEFDYVENIWVNDVVMSNTQNGARIKVFPGSPDPNSVQGGGTGYARNITFQNFEVIYVDNPILIDQCYDYENATYCTENPATLPISDVHYINFFGTGSGLANATVVNMECSAPCTNITATDINIVPPALYLDPVYWCQNVESLDQLEFDCVPPTQPFAAPAP